MDERTSAAPYFESRWPVILALVSVLAILLLLPETIRILPLWTPFAVGVAVLIPILGVQLSAARSGWVRIEHLIILIFVVFAGVSLSANLANLVGVTINRPAHITGLQLLTSSIGLWITNVLVFSLLYWHIDRGGPEARAINKRGRPDWQFAQPIVPVEDMHQGGQPAFVDYLYLGFSTATSFGTTDTIPLSARAKLLMMLQGTISLLTIVLVAARAINILGS